MRTIQRWARAAAAVMVSLAGLSTNGVGAAGVPEPPAPGTVTPAGGGGQYASIPPACIANSQSMPVGVNLPIPDPGVITSTVSVAALGAFVWEVRVTTNLTHTQSNDIDIFLVSPAGTRVTLTTDNGGTNDNVFNGTYWVDSAALSNAPGLVTLMTYTNLVPEQYLVPEEPLGAFLGESPNGIWTLEVHDDNGNGQTGQFISWMLELRVLASVPTGLTDTVTNVYNTPIPPDGTPLYIDFEGPAPLGRRDVTTFTTNIQHAHSNDLIFGVRPGNSNQDITLAYREGGPNANVFSGTVWADTAGAINAPGPVTDNAFTNGVTESPLAPQEPLRASAEGYGYGTWEFGINDNDDNGLTGTVKSLSATVTSYACGPSLYMNVFGPEVGYLDRPLPLVLPIQNLGLTTTAPIYLTVTLPVSLPFVSLDQTGWNCTKPNVGDVGGSVYCNRPSLAAGTTTTVTVRLTPPTIPQAIGAYDAVVTGGGSPDSSCDCSQIYVGARSANLNLWDVYDQMLFTNYDMADSGGMDDGGQDSFDDFGMLRLEVFDGEALQTTSDTYGLRPFGLVFDASQHWHTTTPVVTDTLEVARSLYAPITENWLRYVDTFTNTGPMTRTVWVAWGGNLGSDDDTLTEATSSGDDTITPADTWAVTIEDDAPFAGDPPVAMVFRSAGDVTYQGAGIYSADPFTTTFPISGEDDLAHVFKLVLAPGASASLAYFVYHGLAEGYSGPSDCDLYDICQPIPEAGSQVALAEDAAAGLAAQPYFCDLTQAQIDKIVNWPGAARACRVFMPAMQK